MAHEYSSAQIQLPPHIASRIKAEGAKVGDWALAPDGRENDHHITVLFGLHGEDPDGVKKLLADEAPIMLTLGKTSLFENDDADVLKAEVHSPDLHRLNKKLRALPHTDTHPIYVPHSTIAYVKPGLGKKFAGSEALKGLQAIIDHVVFSSKDGTKTKIPLNLQDVRNIARMRGMMKAPA